MSAGELEVRMAEQRRSGRSKGVPHHPLVEALASDPNSPPGRSTKLFGFPGPAADSNSTRLWLDADLTSYVDVPNDAILHSQTLENDRGTILWVDPAATLGYSQTQTQEVQAEFLGGPIARENLAAAAPAFGRFPAADFGRLDPWNSVGGPFCLKPGTWEGWCPSDVWPCPTQEWRCQTPVFPCNFPSEWIPCAPSTDLPCPTRDVVICPQPTREFAGCPPWPPETCWRSIDPAAGGRITPVGPFRRMR
jgi:hypothetical protein